MTISVLIAVYNAENTIKTAIGSILNQTFQDFEIIIIDDKCTDKTIDVIKEFEDSRIKIISNEHNMGQIKSLNKGLSFCSGKFIARMDADDISLPQRFELQVQAFEKNPELVLVGTTGFKSFPNGRVKKLTYYPRNAEALRFFSMFKSPINHISVMIRQEYLKNTDIFDESYIIATDWDLWSRYLIKRYKIKILMARCFIYRVYDTSYSVINTEIKDKESIKIVKRNVLHYTDLTISSQDAFNIINLHYCKKLSAKQYIKSLFVWIKIISNYKYDSRRDFIAAVGYDFFLIIAKFLRLLIKSTFKFN
ncbi:MAG: glycosyltransferase [bacterium]|nr:glycosyltransferase [bacterium]